MATLFISDLHLQAENPELNSLFLEFLSKQKGKLDALYILGDLFEAWVGDDDHSPFANKITAALYDLKQSGVKLYFLPGNRDFLIGRSFCEKTGCVLLNDPTKICLYGENILLLHGDSLCTKDKLHMFARRLVHHPLIKKLLLSLPLSYRQKIAKKWRAASQLRNNQLSLEIMDCDSVEIANTFKKYDVTTLIHGHTHRPGIHYSRKEDQWLCRVVLSDWHHHAHALWCDNGGKRLITL